MSQEPFVIPKHPVLKPAEDYYRLRREGIGFIEQMGSRHWTDYNQHDPGITILEALCYAITDLAYRIGWNIKDILAPVAVSPDPSQPFPDQAFFTARNILTINPCTPDDFRRLLIDRNAVRNAWVFCKACACDLQYYAWCEENKVMLGDAKPTNQLLFPQLIKPLGLYEVLLELESDPELGDLNNSKIEHTYSVYDTDGKPHKVTLELRFPAWELEKQEASKLFLASTAAFTHQDGQSFTLKLLKFNRTSDQTDTTLLSDADLQNNWRNLFYISYEIELLPGGEKITIDNITLRIFGNTTAKNQTTESQLRAVLGDATTGGMLQRYRHKLLKVAGVVAETKALLHAHRNLDEDYCRISRVNVEDVAVCADVEVAPDADIERIQAQIWFEITQYLNPPVPFYTLTELLNEDIPVEEIFNGPALSNGFIKAEELAAAELKTVLRTSDLLNRLMDIEGVIAVNNLLLSKYDLQGNLVKGAADQYTIPPDPNKTSASWTLQISELHQPRLYFNYSRFLFYKNGLPFQPRMDEALDTLIQLQGESERPKINNTLNDLAVPAGTFRDPENYFPVQYSLPRTYGVNPDGLPSHASPLRRAQARQLKAYLLVFEQIIGNTLAQVAHTADLFSLDPEIKRTYFVREFNASIIEGYTDLINGLDALKLEEITETPVEFYERRNRFLDHLMARFGEQFREYALLLTNYRGEQVSRERLLDDKISFLKAYPVISHDRAKAFNYASNPSYPDNEPGLKRRVSLLLGYPDLTFSWTLTGILPGPFTVTKYQLKDQHEKVWLEGDMAVAGLSKEKAIQHAFHQIMRQMVRPAAYDIVDETGQFRLKIKDKNNNPLGQHPKLFATSDQAEALRDELAGWSSNERAIIVEHLLLRPKFPGDALFDLCEHDSCTTCEDDPYSFRLTLVMPGWVEPYNVNLDMRRFANRTIQQETPSHLLGKVCWVGNDGFIQNPCDQVVVELAEILEKQEFTGEVSRPDASESCICATAIYTTFSEVFQAWYENKTLDFMQADALKTELQGLLATIDPTQLSCTSLLKPEVWAEILDLMVIYYKQVVLYGWQFERFEDAWYTWLETNATFDWPEERLPERIEAILLSNALTSSTRNERAALCKCATDILMAYGASFYNWMDANLTAGTAFRDFTAFVPDPVVLCREFTFEPGTEAAISTLLANRYQAYQEVSYRLRVVINLLSKLRNTYPGATLHDCDDGSDQNPVRLGSTALGNYPLRRSAAATPESPDPGNTPLAPAIPPVPATDIQPGAAEIDSADTPKPSKSAKTRKPKPPKDS